MCYTAFNGHGPCFFAAKSRSTTGFGALGRGILDQNRDRQNAATMRIPPQHMAVCQNLVPLVNIKIAGKWMFIPLKMVLIGIDPYPYILSHKDGPKKHPLDIQPFSKCYRQLFCMFYASNFHPLHSSHPPISYLRS